MAGKQGAALQQYNNELVKCIDELSRRRRTLQNEIDRDEAERQKLEMEVAAAKEKLDAVESRLAQRTSRMESYDKAIAKSEAAYLKILESSQVLLSVVKKETKELTKDAEEG